MRICSVAIVFLASTVFTSYVSQAQTQIESDLTFIDNGKVRIGVKKGSGAGIAWFSQSGSERNLVNHWDHGRLIQQSYYGKKDGSLWNKKPWRWNPVQGGDWQGSPAKVLSLEVTDNLLTAKSVGKHWANGKDLNDVIFDMRITLKGQLTHIHFKMTYSGDITHPEAHQEIPAVFMAPDLKTLVHYSGDQPWKEEPLTTSIPGWPNESHNIDENWAAYVDDENFGMGVYVPIAQKITCYRFGDGKPEHGSCSYFAPITKFAVTPGMTFEYDVYLTLGNPKDIRKRFHEIRAQNNPS